MTRHTTPRRILEGALVLTLSTAAAFWRAVSRPRRSAADDS